MNCFRVKCNKNWSVLNYFIVIKVVWFCVNSNSLFPSHIHISRVVIKTANQHDSISRPVFSIIALQKQVCCRYFIFSVFKAFQTNWRSTFVCSMSHSILRRKQWISKVDSRTQLFINLSQFRFHPKRSFTSVFSLRFLVSSSRF